MKSEKKRLEKEKEPLLMVLTSTEQLNRVKVIGLTPEEAQAVLLERKDTLEMMLASGGIVVSTNPEMSYLFPEDEPHPPETMEYFHLSLEEAEKLANRILDEVKKMRHRK